MDNHRFDECMGRIVCGDKSGLREIYEAYISYIYAIIQGIVGNKENAEDLTTEFFIRLWHTADAYKQGGGHKAWMTTIARNITIDFVRQHGREQLTENVETAADDVRAETVSEGVEDEVLGRMTFKETVNQLPVEERQIVTMKIAGQMTFREIAKILNMPMGTVTWKYQKSMERLRRAGV